MSSTVAEKGHPPRVGAGPAAGSVGYGRDPPQEKAGRSGGLCRLSAAGPAHTRRGLTDPVVPLR